jgi:hypothetical protein
VMPLMLVVAAMPTSVVGVTDAVSVWLEEQDGVELLLLGTVIIVDGMVSDGLALVICVPTGVKVVYGL